jgi:uncharacterized protein YueI
VHSRDLTSYDVTSHDVTSYVMHAPVSNGLPVLVSENEGFTDLLGLILACEPIVNQNPSNVTRAKEKKSSHEEDIRKDLR